MTTVLTREQLTQLETEHVRRKLLSLQLTGSPVPLVLGHALDGFRKTNLTPIIGTEFERGVQLAQWLKASNADELIRDLAILGKLPVTQSMTRERLILELKLVSQRGVVFFRDQDITIDEQKLLGTRLGELTGKPPSSKLHVHPITEESSALGDEIRVISSERLQKTNAARQDKSSLSA